MFIDHGDRRIRLVFAAALTLVGVFGWPAEGETIPEALHPWASDQYSVRYFLRVEPPPAAGATGILPEPEIASLYLPLAMFSTEDAEAPRIEQILLLDDTGQVQPVFLRMVRGGNEVEVAFPTRLARRRYCLYAGARDGRAEPYSPQAFEPRALTVRVRGYSTPGVWRQERGALTGERLDQAIRRGRQLGEAVRRVMFDDDPPFEESYRRDRGLDSGTVPISDKNYAAIYEGYLRTPVNGTYGFAVNTFGIVDLQVDGAEILSVGAPDENRQPFTLTGQTELRAGIHRVSMRYAQAGGKAGVYLLWKPPGQRDFLGVSGQSFPRALPAVVMAREVSRQPAPFIGVELTGFYRTGIQDGAPQAREWVEVLAYGSGVAEGALFIHSPGVEPVEGPVTGSRAFFPAGQLIDIEWRKDAQVLARRSVLFPTGEQGGRDRMEVTGELAVKEVPRFLYPDETGQFHFETQLSPIIRLMSKQRHTQGPEAPHPLPVGAYRLTWRLLGLSAESMGEMPRAGELPATPDLTGRRKIRLPLSVGPIECALRERSATFEVELLIGGLPASKRVYRILHSRAAWDGRLESRTDGLLYVAGKDGTRVEEPLFVVPREDDSAYRRFQLGRPGGAGAAGEALFLGDPLVESATPLPLGTGAGLSLRLPGVTPGCRWMQACVAGPHRGYYIFHLLAAADHVVHAAPDGRVPRLVVVSLGAGDMIRQTPGYDFERGLDLLVDRLRRAGAERIFVLGVMPLPEQEKASQLYQNRATEVIRRHHLESMDLLAAWSKSADWARRFLIPAEPDTQPAYAPVPNAETLDEIARRIAERIK